MTTVKKSFISSVLLIVDSIFKKSVGLVSTLVLARVLLPEDFGIIAIVTLMTGFLNVFTRTGMSQYIIRSDNPDTILLNTAFSLELLIRTVLACLLFAAAYPIASLYEDFRLVSLLQVYSILFIIAGLANPAVNLLKRQQKYGSIVKMTMIVKVISTTSAVSVALIFESYWAMAIGQLVSVSLATIGGYVIYPYLPRLQFTNLKEQWSFSGWLIPQSLLGYFRTQFDTLLISNMFGQEKLGSYHTMKYLAYIPSSEFILPATQPLLAQLAPLRDKPDYFNSRCTIASIVSMALAIPVAIFLFFHSYNFVLTLLGTNWIEHYELFGWFSLIIPAYAMYHNANRTLLIYSKTQYTFYYEVVCTTVIISTLLLVSYESIFDLAKIKTNVELTLSFIYFSVTSFRYTNLKCTCVCIFSIVVLVIISCILSYLTFTHIHFTWPILTLFVAGTVFLFTYALFCMAFILLTKKHFFVSQYLFELATKALRNNLLILSKIGK